VLESVGEAVYCSDGGNGRKKVLQQGRPLLARHNCYCSNIN